MNSRKLFALRQIVLLSLTIMLISCRQTSSGQPGTSHSLPVPPALFLLSSQGDVQAYRADGTRLWQGRNDHPSHPTQTGTHLILSDHTLFVATNTLQAYRDNGQLRWQHDLPAQADTSLLLGTMLSVVAGGTVSTWDTATGALRWQQEKVASFPVAVTLNSDTQRLYIGNRNQVTALSLQSGAQEWSIEGDPGERVRDLVSAKDQLLIRTDSSLTVVQAATGRIIWQRQSQVQAMFLDPTGILYTIFLDTATETMTSGLRALRLDTGKQLWTVSFPIHDGENGSISSTGIVWANTTSITAWDLNGKHLWQQPYVGRTILQMTPIEPQHLVLMQSHDGTITALNALTGRQQWQQTVPGGKMQVIVQSALIWVLSTDVGEIDAFTFDGFQRWTLANHLPIHEVIITRA